MSLVDKEDSKNDLTDVMRRFFDMIRESAKKYGKAHQGALNKMASNQKKKKPAKS